MKFNPKRIKTMENNNYEQKHKEDLEEAKSWLAIAIENNDKIAIQILEKFFPELKESEDEKIRKALIGFLKSPFVNENITDEKVIPWIAWLEKQGEKLPADKVEPKFKVGDIIRHKKKGFTCKIIAVDTEYRLSECNGTHLPFDFQDSYELVEQNPAWSEEDEYQINTILHGLDLKREIYKKKENKVEEERYTVQYNWLKSLKEKIKGE